MACFGLGESHETRNYTNFHGLKQVSSAAAVLRSAGLSLFQRVSHRPPAKPHGPLGDPQTSGEVPTRLALRASPCPSPQPSPSGKGTIRRRLFPLPVGESQGEGNRLAVRPSDSNPSRNCRTSRVVRQSRRFPITMTRRTK